MHLSHWEGWGSDFPEGASQIPLGNPAGSFSGGEWDFQRAARKASGRTGGAPRGGEGGGSRGEAALAVSHSAARVGGSPLPCARHFLWGTFLRAISCLGSWVVNRPPIILVVERGHLRPFAPHDLFKAYFSFHRVHRDTASGRGPHVSPPLTAHHSIFSLFLDRSQMPESRSDFLPNVDQKTPAAGQELAHPHM